MMSPAVAACSVNAAAWRERPSISCTGPLLAFLADGASGISFAGVCEESALGGGSVPWAKPRAGAITKTNKQNIPKTVRLAALFGRIVQEYSTQALRSFAPLDSGGRLSP